MKREINPVSAETLFDIMFYKQCLFEEVILEQIHKSSKGACLKKKFLGATHETKRHLCFFWKNPKKAKLVGRAEGTGKEGKEGVGKERLHRVTQIHEGIWILFQV